jgi:sec-independent protein translocase protein TatB
MFDIGFWELLIIAVVALLVVGPERLPGLARTAGMWVGKVRRFVNSVKADIDREVRTEELQKLLNKQNEFRKDIYDIVEDTKRSVEETRKSVEATQKSVEENVEGSVAQQGRAESGAQSTMPSSSELPDTSAAEPSEPARSDGEKRSAG